MKNYTLLILFIGTFLFNSNAQPPEYEDLIVYFADADYEKLLKKADKYAMGDKTRKDAIPYLYLSKANYEINKEGGELLEKYPRAFKDAVKYAGKCLKYDEEGNVFKENMAHFTALKASIFETLRILAEAGDFGRLRGQIPLMYKIDNKEVGTIFLQAAASYYSKDRAGMKDNGKKAEEYLAAADPSAYTISDDDDYDLTAKKKIDLELLKLGVTHYCNALVDGRQVDKAKDLLGRIIQWYPEDKEFKEFYDSIVN